MSLSVSNLNQNSQARFVFCHLYITVWNKLFYMSILYYSCLWVGGGGISCIEIPLLNALYMVSYRNFSRYSSGVISGITCSHTVFGKNGLPPILHVYSSSSSSAKIPKNRCFFLLQSVIVKSIERNAANMYIARLTLLGQDRDESSYTPCQSNNSSRPTSPPTNGLGLAGLGKSR